MLLHFDFMLMQFSLSLKLTHARLEGCEDTAAASQLDTGFGRSIARVKPLLERKGRQKTKRKENAPPIASALPAVGRGK